MYDEQNTGSNLPAQIDLYTNSKDPLAYDFHFMAKGTSCISQIPPPV
jgi:fumarate hydratase class I